MRLPLFPLNLVLFPGQKLPLHIFEERYKEMLQRCLKEQIPFGLVLARGSGRSGRGTPHSIGTLAVITTVEEVEEGRCVIPGPHSGNCYQISCHGDERFRVQSIDRGEASYLVGEIEVYPDEEAPPPALAAVAERVSTLFDEYYRGIIALMGGWQRPMRPGESTLMFDVASLMASQARLDKAEPGEAAHRVIKVPTLPLEPAALSHAVAAELNSPPQIKQDLLEFPSALGRLQREAELLAEEAPQLEERLALQAKRRYTAFGISN